MATENESSALRKAFSEDLMETLVRFALIGFLVVMSVRVFAPFGSLMVWGLILAVALYPLHNSLSRRLGGRQGLSATLLVLTGLLLIGTPTVVLGGLFVDSIHDVYDLFETESVTINPPNPSVAEWPIIGEKLYTTWSMAANDMAAFLEGMQPQLGEISRKVLSVAASTMGGIFGFLAALIIAGIMMAFGESGSGAMLRILNRLSGPANGPRIQALTTGTIRSVATGVIGVAFIQALLLGIGFAGAGVPAAGLLAAIVLLMGIMQLPPVIVALPAVVFIWWSGDASTTSNAIWTVYLVIASMSDNVLKPMLLGRGVDVPMPVILIGALGGMISAGIVGLFIGAVLLAVGYQLFMDWVDVGDAAASAEEAVSPEALPSD